MDFPSTETATQKTLSCRLPHVPLIMKGLPPKISKIEEVYWVIYYSDLLLIAVGPNTNVQGMGRKGKREEETLATKKNLLI